MLAQHIFTLEFANKTFFLHIFKQSLNFIQLFDLSLDQKYITYFHLPIVVVYFIEYKNFIFDYPRSLILS